jgi:sugar phosphate isomerase/epimerase
LTRFGLINWNAPGERFAEFVDWAVQTGYAYAEVDVGFFAGSRQDPDVKAGVAAAAAASRQGLRIWAVSCYNDFLVRSPEAMAAQVARMETVAALAAEAGIPILRMDGGWEKDGVPKERWLDLVVEGFSRCVPIAERHGLTMALDNHGTVTNDVEFQLAVLTRVGSKRLGANLDTMNYRWYGYSVEECRAIYDRVAPHTVHTHLKDGRGSRGAYVGEAPGEGEIDLTYAVRALQNAGYSGIWCVEQESKEKAGGYAKGLAWLQANVQ